MTADVNRGVRWADLLTRTQVGVALLLLLAAVLFVSSIPVLEDESEIFGPAVWTLVVGAGVLSILEYLQFGTWTWGLVGGNSRFDATGLVIGAIRLVELGIAVVIGVILVGLGWIGSLPGGSPRIGGYLLVGFSGLAILGVLLAGTVLLRVVVAAIAGGGE